MTMRPRFVGFWIEKRGKNNYGFCDDACGAIVRENYWHCVAAMEAHRRDIHGGQMLLDLTSDKPVAWKKGDPFPF